MRKATVSRVDHVLLRDRLSAAGEPAYRAAQVWEWVTRGVAGYGEMTNLPAGLRETLGREVPFSSLELEREEQASDGTVKALFRTADGHPVEAVLMRYRDGRRSICVSSQSGCPLTCTFCATGSMQFGRNLTTSEILDQALHFRRLEETGQGKATQPGNTTNSSRGGGPSPLTHGRAPKPGDTMSSSRGGGASPLTHGRAPKPGDTMSSSRSGGASPLTHCVFMGMGEPFL